MPQNSEVKASVVIPVYNAQDTLEQCLESVRLQTLGSFEALLVDDGSSDRSADIARRYAEQDPRFTVLVQENAGPGVARNRAIDLARGEYVLCVDCDDWIDETLLERAVSEADRLGADVVVWDAWLHDQRTGDACLSSVVRLDQCGEDGFRWRDDPDCLLTSFQNWPWNKLVRRSLLDEHGIRFQEIHRTEDLMYSGRALVKARLIAGIPAALSHYRMGQAESAMATKDAYPLDFFHAFEAFKAWLEEEGCWEALKLSYSHWAFQSALVNMKTLRSWESYEEVYRFMREEGFARLGLAGPGSVLDDWESAELSAIMEGSAGEYALRALHHEWTVREDAGVLAGRRWFELEERARAAEALRAEIGERDGRIERLSRELEEERAAREAVERDREDLLNSAEQKVGRALCALPRAVQRAMRDR